MRLEISTIVPARKQRRTFRTSGASVSDWEGITSLRRHCDSKLVNSGCLFKCSEALISRATILHDYFDCGVRAAITSIRDAGNGNVVRATFLNVPTLYAVTRRTRYALSVYWNDIDHLALAEVSGFGIMREQDETRPG